MYRSTAFHMLQSYGIINHLKGERRWAWLTEKTYIAIDLKSFYASVECQKLGKDPLTTNLVVADKERTDKTICLAVSPSLKEYGVWHTRPCTPF